MPKKLNRDELIKLLQIVDEKLDENAELIAIGGTALNLLGLKKVTFDADFILENPDPLLKVDIILHITTAGVDTQIQDPGTIVMFELPHDYKRTVLEDKELNRLFTKIQIKILPPLDVLITKLSRFDPKDIKDITDILSKQKYSLSTIEKRFNQFYQLFHGNKQNLMKNFLAFKKLYSELQPKT